jgi:hypothetical protein
MLQKLLDSAFMSGCRNRSHFNDLRRYGDGSRENDRDQPTEITRASSTVALMPPANFASAAA